MKKKTGIVALSLLAIFSMLTFSGCKDRHSKTTFMLDYVSEVLDLTEEQEVKLNTIKEELQAEAELMHADKKQIHETLKEQISGEVIDKEVMRQLAAEHRQKSTGLIDLAIDRLADFHADLTPEQRTKLVTKLEKFEKYHGNRFKQ